MTARLTAAVFVLLMGCPTATSHRDAGSVDASVVIEDKDALIDAGVEFCAAYARARCALRERCLTLQPTQRVNCEADQRETCLRSASVLTGSAALIDGGASCLASLASTSDCNFECSPFEVGGHVGETCVNSFRCRESLCVPGNLCPVCGPYTAIGAACVGETCNPREAFCDFNATRVCTAQRDAGETCTRLGECRDQAPCLMTDAGVKQCGFVDGAPCAFEECGADAFCEGFLFNGSGVCRHKRALGENCTGSDFFQCAPDATCLDGACARTNASDRTAGQECRTNGDCVFPLRCVGNGAPRICTAPLDAGELCTGGDCAPGFQCACGDMQCLGERHCRRLSGVGEPCGFGSDALPCLDQLACVSTGGRFLCVPKAAAGEACVSPLDCAVPNLCVRGLCAAPLGAGGHCDSPAECSSFVCNLLTQQCVECQ
ncbi:MAG: hypothetical protein QM817_35920 [Archangium sp.]